MKKSELKFFEKVYEAEVTAALTSAYFNVYQSKAKIAQSLVDKGFIHTRVMTLGNIKVEGYELTNFGRMTYCMSCEEGFE